MAWRRGSRICRFVLTASGPRAPRPPVPRPPPSFRLRSSWSGHHRVRAHDDGRPRGDQLRPMGVEWGDDEIVIKPFLETTTFKNLEATRFAVINLTDDVML